MYFYIIIAGQSAGAFFSFAYGQPGIGKYFKKIFFKGRENFLQI